MSLVAVVSIFIVLITLTVIVNGPKRVMDSLNSKYVKSCVAIIAAVVMYYTPDEIDRIILAILALFEITPLTLDTIRKNND